MSILAEIFAHKQVEVVAAQQQRPLSDVAVAAQQTAPPRDFTAALRRAAQRNGSPALIAEIKRASPSRGRLAPNLDALTLARIYAENGASAISVLTDTKYFQGSLADLQTVAQSGLGLPLLRKDFICDAYQVYEARQAGADAVLLIVAGLEAVQLAELHALVCRLGMTPLVEVHNRDELDVALACDSRCIGINNRNLHDFTVSLETTRELRQFIPSGVCVVAESGIHTRADVQRLADAGVDAILVGEALVTAADIPVQVRSLACRG